MTPFVIGSEPAHAWSGRDARLSVLQQEHDDGLRMITALSDLERHQAVLNFSNTGNNNLTEAFGDNVVRDDVGLRTDALTGLSRRQSRDRIALCIGNLDEGPARMRMDQIDRHLDRTWLASIGGTPPDSVFHTRIQSPVLLIEFDHQHPVGLAELLPDQPTRRQMRCVVRTPDGHDDGHDLLRQHDLTDAHGA